jgi:CheY-like chemotaxis protein
LPLANISLKKYFNNQSIIMFYKSSTTVPTVLAVDDNHDNLLLISYVMKGLNCQCYGVIDSTKVVDLAADKIPNLILLNIVMPTLSGFDIISQLKSNLLTKNIPVIAVTGLADIYYQEKISSAGFDDYICKPFILEEFEDKLIKYLNIFLV